MKKSVLTVALLSVAITLMAACTSKPKADNPASAAVEAVEVAAEGELAPDFELPNLQGTTTKLSSLRGKYVVLDFWGSWCIWCIRGIPHMKEAYAKYKDKMEILGVDCRDTEEKWRAAVDEHQLPWLQVRCPNEQLQTIAAQYGIEGFPTKIVIDPQGKIAKIIVGEDPAFYTYLAELFK
nr:TlpA disulfide reductase family protein [Prevotella sp. MA2016]